MSFRDTSLDEGYPAAPSADQQLAAVKHAELKLYSDNRMGVDLLAPILTAVLAVLFMEWIPWPQTILWAVITIALYGWHTAICRQFLSAKPSLEDWPDWSRRITATHAAHLSAFSMIGLFFWVPDAEINPIFILGVLGGATGLIIAQCSCHLPLFVSSLLPMGLIMVVRPLLERDVFFVGVGLFMAIYLGYAYAMARRMNETATTMLKLREDKEGLITKLNAAKKQSVVARSQAETANQAKSAFLARMSHELRTPLNAILGFSEILSKELLGPLGHNAYREYSTNIEKSGQHLLGLINDILDISRIEAGRFELAEEMVDVTSVVDECVRTMTLGAREAQIDLISKLPLDLPYLWADERALRQIIYNLISNALKFTPIEGQVLVQAEVREMGDMIVSVTDTGPGIAADDIPKALETFGQLDTKEHAAKVGTGLGLPIVKGLAELHGAEFEIASEVGLGTTISVTLPKTRVMANRIDMGPRPGFEPAAGVA